MKKLYCSLLIAPLLLAATTYGASSADELWTQLQTLRRNGPAKQQVTTMEERNAVITKFLDDCEKASDAFIHEFPNDKRVWEARLYKLEVTVQRPSFGGQKLNLSQFESLAKEITDSPEASKVVRGQAAFDVLAVHAQLLADQPQPSKLAEFDKEISAFTPAYPNDTNNRNLPGLRLTVYEKTDPAKFKELLKALADDNGNPRLAMMARQRLKTDEMQANLQNKPLDLKFTAVDGTEFDIAKLRGKVVLVDFWATWCGPCRAELPHVLEAYKKHHEKGFEIVGISLDQSKDKLLTFTKQNEMVWPQYFDGKGWGNSISSGFGIQSIPAMWLVDKKGMVRSTEARGDLEGLVAKLLSE